METGIMNQLTVQLREADQICTEAYPFFEKAAKIRADAETKACKGKKTKKIISVVAALIFAAIPGQLIITLLGGIGELIDIGIAIALGVFLYKKVFMTKIEEDLSDANKTADAEDAKGTEILESNISVLSVIPGEYWYPKATGYILRVIQTGRADSINQALVMFDEQNHRWKVEEANASIVAQQTEQTKALKGIRRSSAVSAGANVVSAASNIARWF